MLLTVILLSIACGLVKSSNFHPVAPVGAEPVVTAASSQYFERTFNRLVTAPLQPVIPVAPVVPFPPPVAVVPAPQPILPVLPLPSARPVVVDAKRTTLVPVTPTNVSPPQNTPVNPNVAIAVATAHAAAPVATILLPPYPFGLPPSFGFVPQVPQTPPQLPENPNNNRESTTRRPTTRVTTTEREQESTTPVSSNIDNSFAQALPSNQNVNFKQYLAPSPVPRPAPQPPRPQKVKTNVEVVPVPLAYIAPPPIDLRHHHHQHQHHHHHHHNHQALKLVPHIHTYIPKTRIIIRPVTSNLRLRTVSVPAGLHATYGPPKLVRKVVKRYPQNIKSQSRDTEPTTFRPLNRPFTKPPRI